MVSIIVPVYNSIKHLGDCIESIRTQSYTNWELILVDDGSSDGSEKLCDQYAEKDARIIVEHQNNQGVSSARWKGVKRSRGEWITFVDNDDILIKNFLEELLKYVEDADIISARGIECSEDKISRYMKERQNQLGEILCYTGQQAAELLNAPKDKKSGIVTLLWGKIIRKDLMNKICEVLDTYRGKIPYNFMEDIFIVPRMFLMAEKVIIVKKDLYLYRYNGSSPSHSFSQTKYNYEQIEVGHLNMEYYKEHGYMSLYNGQLPHFYLIMLKIWYMSVVGEKNREIRKWCNQQVEKYYKIYMEDLKKIENMPWKYCVVIKLWGVNPNMWKNVIGDLYFRGIQRK